MPENETTLSPRESGVFIAEHSEHVHINEEVVPKVAVKLYSALESGELGSHSMIEHETFPSTQLSQRDALNYVLFIDTINFGFWQNEKQQVEYKGKKYAGYFSLCAAVARAYDEGVCMFDPNVYSKFTFDELSKLLKNASGPSSLVSSRLKCLHEVGTTLVNKYEGSFENCIVQAKNNAQTLLKLIVEDFPCFDDSCEYLGKRVSFHKRAQILVGDMWELYYGKGICHLDDVDSITMFADYRVPQSLVHFGVMKYSDELMAVLQKGEILESGSQYEVEIRGCSIRAVDLIVQAVKKYMKEGDRKYYPDCNDITVDNYLWTYRRLHGRSVNEIPYHKVVSIYY